jgi:glycosyltransferase EpsD
MKHLHKQIHGLKVIFAGEGVLLEKSKFIAGKNGLANCIDFVGYRTDLEKWMAMADVCISTSRQEGLGLNVAEAMFCGLPVVVSQIRGHVDLVTHRVNGLLFEEGDQEEFIRLILELYHSPEKRKQLGTKAMKTVKPFGIDQVLPNMNDIYKKYLS